MEQNLKVAVKILLKTMDSATPSPERVELSTLRREGQHMVHYTLSDEEVQKFITEIQAEIDAEQKKSDAAAGNI